VSDSQRSDAKTPLIHRPAIRWAVPGAVVAIALGAAAISSVTADTTPTLPPRSAAELLVDVQSASLTALSGTVVQDAALGLPELPVQIGGQGSSSFSALVSGTHTLRVWYAGEDQQRVAVQGTLEESDVVRNGSDVWTWASDSNTATHYQLPAGAADKALAEHPDSSAAAMTPQQAAEAALAAIDPTTTVTTDGTATVAGRSAYELVLGPKDTASLVGQVRIAIDAEQHIPLRVQVYAKDPQTPAFQVGFSDVSFDVPDAANFQFSPRPGATVTESTLGNRANVAAPGATDQSAAPELTPSAGAEEPTIVGTGWTSVLVAKVPTAATTPDTTAPDSSAPPTTGTTPGGPAARGSAADLNAILGSLPAVSGDWGSGRLLQSALFSVLITDDGRIIAGAVAPEKLYEAAR
jgi:outer membrane lipoprotein-sorting protein